MDETIFTAFREKLFTSIEQATNIVITAHLSPDDDSIGSVMALYEILTLQFPTKNIDILYEGEPSYRHKDFSHFNAIKFVPSLGTFLGGVDLLIVADVSSYVRISKQPDILQQIPTRAVIDHHSSTPDVFTLSLIDKSYSSNAELIYHIFHDVVPLNKPLAESVLLGILGDTGNLSYISPKQSNVFMLVKTLVETVDMSIDSFRARYGGIPKQIIPLLQELVQNTQYISCNGWPDMQYSYIEDIKNYSDEDMSAASHIYMSQYLPRIEGYSWGLVSTPRSDKSIRISGRALSGSVNVRDLFEKMKIGGGHDRASGASMKDVTPKVAIQKIEEWMNVNTPFLS